jgi:hypothetical protein
VKQITQYHTEEYKGIEFQHCTQRCGEHITRTCDAWKDEEWVGRVYYRVVSKGRKYWVLKVKGKEPGIHIACNTEKEYSWMVERLKEGVTDV